MLLSVGKDAKTVKGLLRNYQTGILYLYPGGWRCPYASEGCRRACLFTSGRGAYSSVQAARALKTLNLERNPVGFKKALIDDIKSLYVKQLTKGYKVCIRLNGTSDLDWSDVISSVPQVQFYDYTKSFWNPLKNTLTNFYKKYIKGYRGKLYHLTYSYKETDKPWKLWLNKLLGINSAVVFFNVPTKYKGIKVIDGDRDDLRFLDPKGVIVGLKAKGRARYDSSGFVK